MILSSKPVQPGLVLGDERWLETAITVTWDSDGQLAKFAFEGFTAFTIAGVASRINDCFMLVMAKMIGHFGLQGTLYQLFSELFQSSRSHQLSLRAFDSL